MKQELVDKKYLLIPNFIDRVTAQEYGDEFIKDDFKYQYESDYEHAPNAAGLYNPIGAAELLCNKTAEVSEIIGETVVPTYSFGRIYRQGDKLLEQLNMKLARKPFAPYNKFQFILSNTEVPEWQEFLFV